MTTESPESKLFLAEETMTTETKKFEVNDTKTERDESAGTKLSANGTVKELTDTTNEENKADKTKERKIGRIKGTALICI